MRPAGWRPRCSSCRSGTRSTLASIGREAEAAPIFTAVFAKEPQWVELLGRLPAAGLFPDDAALIGGSVPGAADPEEGMIWLDT